MKGGSKMTSWIIPCNIKYYDVMGAFNKLSKLDWKQSTNIENGDLVYIYVGKPYQSVMFKCRVNKVNLPVVEIDDSEFVISGDVYVNYGNYMELELLAKYTSGSLSFDRLVECGLTGRIYGPRRASGAVLELLSSEEA